MLNRHHYAIEGYTGVEAVARADSFRDFWVYAFSALLALFLFGCGLEEDNPPAGGTSLQGNASTGETLYTSKGCSGCHGAEATGGIGPNIQGGSADHIETMAGTGQMASVSVTAQEAADISAFLATVETEDADVTDDDGEKVIPASQGNAENGAALFADKGCVACHAADATGGIGPNIQQDTVKKITSFVGVVPPMTGISLTPQDRADIVAWLQTLTGGDGDGDGDADSGAALFVDKGCVACHAADATGGIGPNIQQVTDEKIASFVGVVPPMTGISLTEQDRRDIAAWLQTL